MLAVAKENLAKEIAEQENKETAEKAEKKEAVTA